MEALPVYPEIRPDRRTSAVDRWIAPTLFLVTLASIWELWSRWRDVPRWLLPPPSVIATTLMEDRGLLVRHTGVTLAEVVLGFALAVVVGVALGAAIDASTILERAVYPLVIASQTIPVIALAPLFLIWFGYGLLPKVLITALIAFFPIAVNTVDGLRQTDPDILDLFRSLGASRWTRFRLAKLPSALPYIFSGAKIAVAVSVIGAVFGELFGSSQGLGYLLDRSMAQFLTARVFAAIALLSLMGITLFAIVALVERVLTPWRRFDQASSIR
jgi:ABC-type nitrate/sulfonate/bicarbonate transport system permease component